MRCGELCLLYLNLCLCSCLIIKATLPDLLFYCGRSMIHLTQSCEGRKSSRTHILLFTDDSWLLYDVLKHSDIPKDADAVCYFWNTWPMAFSLRCHPVIVQ
jgi:hypothetical protein